ncbi:MAG: ATP synthase subunit I [Myxococcota bacterium]
MSASGQTGIERFLSGVLRLLVVLVPVSGAATHLLAGPGELLWGVLAGGALGLLNFAALVWLGRRILRAETRSRTFYGVLFFVKLTLLVAAVFLLLRYLPLAPLGFLIGISLLVPAVILMILWTSLAPAAAITEGGQAS